MNLKIAFLGAGNMSGAIIKGLIGAGFKPGNLTATNRSPATRQGWAEMGLKVTDDNNLAVQDADVVVLGVKPVMIDDVLKSIATDIPPSALIVSVAAGVPMANYERRCPQHAITRVMPNTPCLVQQGVSGVFHNAKVTDHHRTLIDALFKPLGVVYQCINEDDIDRVIAVAGSAPAYHFLFLESIVAAGVSLGLREADAREMAVQTALGAAKMAQNSPDSLEQLRLNVTSPGGTTAEAIKSFESNEIRSIVATAMKACTNRAKEMASELTLREESN